MRLKRAAKADGGFFVEDEPALAFVIRIRGINDMHPKSRKILQLLRLKQIHNGIFIKVPCHPGHLYGKRTVLLPGRLVQIIEGTVLVLCGMTQRVTSGCLVPQADTSMHTCVYKCNPNHWIIVDGRNDVSKMGIDTSGCPADVPRLGSCSGCQEKGCVLLQMLRGLSVADTDTRAICTGF